MYGITLGSAECPVFYEDGTTRTSSFSLSETRTIINNLLDRKSRNNGVGKYLFDTLRTTGCCRHDFSRKIDPLAFYCRASRDGRYTIVLFGTYPHELIGRLNRPAQQLRAIHSTRSVRAKRRELRAAGLYKDSAKQKTPRALAGASGNLKRHFQKSKITCSDAVEVIAYAAKLDPAWVRDQLVESLDTRAVASLRLKGGFVFRVDLIYGWRGLLSLSAPVEVRTTNDNTHGAYRRLRSALRKRLKLERKVRVREQEEYLAAQKLRETIRRLFA